MIKPSTIDKDNRELEYDAFYLNEEMDKEKILELNDTYLCTCSFCLNRNLRICEIYIDKENKNIESRYCCFTGRKCRYFEIDLNKKEIYTTTIKGVIK